MSASERTRFLGARTLAVFHQSNPGLGEAGRANTFASSTVSYRAAGQQGYVQQTAQKPVLEVPACCAAAVSTNVTCVPPGDILNVRYPAPIPGTDPVEYDYNAFSWDPVPGASYYVLTPNVTATITYPDNTATVASIDLSSWNWNDSEAPNYAPTLYVTVTAYNSCGSSQATVEVAPCFLAGSIVQMADGSTKAIEDVVIGDVVLGAFGEHNQVLALHRPLLGSHTMCSINNEHSTTSHHPHIAPDRRFYCVHPAKVDNATYGREHPVLTETGEEMRFLHGLAPGRVQLLETGVELKTVEGSRIVESLDLYNMPEDTQLYNLVVGGSHTYHVDGYAVTGWPREDDFDYDAWIPRG